MVTLLSPFHLGMLSRGLSGKDDVYHSLFPMNACSRLTHPCSLQPSYRAPCGAQRAPLIKQSKRIDATRPIDNRRLQLCHQTSPATLFPLITINDDNIPMNAFISQWYSNGSSVRRVPLSCIVRVRPRARCFRVISNDLAAPAALNELLRSKSQALTEDHLEKFRILSKMLLWKNTEVNLTGLRTTEQVYAKHFYDSLTLLEGLDARLAVGRNEARILDLGSGSGFPGLALAIARPNWHVTLLDATRKKCDWQREAVDALGLANVDIVWDRVEQRASAKALREVSMREQFDVVVARAVAELRVLLELALPCVQVGGYFMAQKERKKAISNAAGEALWTELEESRPAIKCLGGLLEAVESVQPPSMVDTPAPDRVIVAVKKISATPLQYPRMGQKIKVKPL